MINPETSIEGEFFLTHGAPVSRKHIIWRFAVGLYEYHNHPNFIASLSCPCSCSNMSWPYQISSFVGKNYFCDTGNNDQEISHQQVYNEDPLWDWEGCGAKSTCCQLNSPPWFSTTLKEATVEYLGLRICIDQSHQDEDVIVSFVEIYVF